MRRDRGSYFPIEIRTFQIDCPASATVAKCQNGHFKGSSRTPRIPLPSSENKPEFHSVSKSPKAAPRRSPNVVDFRPPRHSIMCITVMAISIAFALAIVSSLLLIKAACTCAWRALSSLPMIPWGPLHFIKRYAESIAMVIGYPHLSRSPLKSVLSDIKTITKRLVARSMKATQKGVWRCLRSMLSMDAGRSLKGPKTFKGEFLATRLNNGGLMLDSSM